jgi:hypothetical protein
MFIQMEGLEPAAFHSIPKYQQFDGRITQVMAGAERRITAAS